MLYNYRFFSHFIIKFAYVYFVFEIFLVLCFQNFHTFAKESNYNIFVQQTIQNLDFTELQSKNVATLSLETKHPYEITSSNTLPTDLIPEKYLQDDANLIKEPIRRKILETCYEIENTLKIRVLIKTEILENLENYSERVEKYFSEWIRSINLDKRGILLYAGLSKNTFEGKFNMRVGVGLKYIITQEIGEKIINQIILPNNLENNDGKGFLEGLMTLKKVLLDETASLTQTKKFKNERFSIVKFLVSSKELLLLLVFSIFFVYFAFFIERCPRCNNNVKITYEILKEAGNSTLGLRRKIYKCSKCGFMRRKKEIIYPSGLIGFKMWLLGANRRNIKLENIHKMNSSNNTNENK